MNLDPKQLSNRRKGRVVGKGFLGELHHGEGTQEDQSNIEHKTAHVRLAHLHGMDLKE